MIDVDLSTPGRAAPPVSPSSTGITIPRPSLGTAALWLALLGMGGVIAHDRIVKPAPAVSTFAASFAAYRAAEPSNLIAAGKLIQAGTLDTAEKVHADLVSRSAAMAAAVKAVVSAHCDKDTGKVTDPAGLAAEFVAAGQAAGGK